MRHAEGQGEGGFIVLLYFCLVDDGDGVIFFVSDQGYVCRRDGVIFMMDCFVTDEGSMYREREIVAIVYME